MKIYDCNTYINNTSYAKKIEKVLINRINYKLRNGNFCSKMFYLYSMSESTKFKHNISNNRCIRVSFDRRTIGLKGRYVIDRLVVTEKIIKRIISYNSDFDIIRKDFITTERPNRTKHIFIKLGKLVSPLSMMP